jgi:methylmalonyl-CoA/ethylmalonyl-CoA epimerase
MENTNSESFKRVIQVGIVVRDIERSCKAWARLLGLETPRIVETEVPEVTGMVYKGKASGGRAKLAFFQLENLSLELIEPIGGPSSWSEFLDRNGEGIHHIAFKVDDIGSAKDILRDVGVNVEQEGNFTGGSYAYTEPDSPLGAILELLSY